MLDDRVGRGRRAALVVMVLVGALAACSSGDDDAPEERTSGSTAPEGTEAGPGAPELPEGWAGYESEEYADEARWLCRPDRADDVCAGEDLTATVIGPDGPGDVEEHVVAEDAPVDCFYVYPTTSQDEGLNADFTPDPNQEVWTARNQAARLTGVCRVFAPIYRQATTAAIGGAGTDAEREAAFARAYEDVVDAFRHYLANDSDGRGVVLVGHSQGAGMLREMIATEVEGEPAVRERVVSALLIGTTVTVPPGELVGGSFAEMPLCTAVVEAGCVVSYATFAADAPPPADSRFGRADEEGLEAACVNPAAPGGGPATLRPYVPTEVPEGTISAATADPERLEQLATLGTPWALLGDFVVAECVQRDGASYLEATVGGPDDPRGDSVGGSLGPDWGLHLVDVNIAMGDIVDLVAAQATAYAQG
jgi:hypothetical protein